MTRDQVTAVVGVDRSLVAYHLDKLVEEGLLAVSFARPEGRSGPGAGRPAKHYQRGAHEFAVSLPPRDYRLAAEVFVRAVETDPTGTVRRYVEQAAADLGRQLAPAGAEDTALALLRRHGFEPYDDDGVIRLRNCPFHRLAQDHTELVCGMNLALLSGLVEALGVGARPRLDPAPGRCCVTVEPA